ncbi:MAG: uroporphyrinogen-III synthase [Motiliproteus sp.]|nr:uroporphyrinogen-III synthase [Motiliproteus sp.]MCW9051356.1 uroporphyrinogen-III synthase [Motiliproteus sp.]
MTPNPSKSLSGQRVLVTRPAHQSASLCGALNDAGAEPVPFPTLQIQAADDYLEDVQPLKQIFLDLDLYHIVIFVSANAARLGHDWIDRYWPQLPLGIQWLAVGDATARTLQELQIEPTSPGKSMNSEALLELPLLHNVEEKRILICRGQGGRECLADTLRNRGARVDYAELYRRRMPDYPEQDIESIIYNFLPSVMLVTSKESLTNLDQLCRGKSHPLPIEQLHQVPVVVPSQRVATTAEQLGYNRILVAENATDTAMIEAIQLNN